MLARGGQLLLISPFAGQLTDLMKRRTACSSVPPSAVERE
jgi:hypothetical protein